MPSPQHRVRCSDIRCHGSCRKFKFRHGGHLVLCLNFENIAALMMATERGVAYTRAAPFPYYGDGATYIEDCNLVDIHHMGMATHIKLYYDFGEWQLYALNG